MRSIALWVLLTFLGYTEAFSCSFDDDFCGFVQRTDDKFDWTRHRGRTSSQGTGPNRDHTTGNGYYLYIEASNKRRHDNAVIERTVSVTNERSCLVFYYHMIGHYIGTLNVYIGTSKIYSKTGKTGFTWNRAEIPLNGATGNQKIAFEGIVGRGFQGDIAIDDVSVEKCSDKVTPAPPVPSTPGVPETTTEPPTQPPTPQPPTPQPPTPQTTTPQTTTTSTGIPTAPPTLPPAGPCGVRPNTRIVGGTNAKQGDWPWQAQLRNTKNYPFCGGTLIHPQWVVTATHCLVRKVANNEKIHVRFGAHHRTRPNKNIQDINVTKIILHPSYHKPIKYAYDVALVKLEKPVILNKFVNLACLPEGLSDPVEDKKCWITGFGAISPSGWLPNYLKQASVPIVGKQRCLKAYPKKLHHESMICGGYDEGGIDSCQGDSGGPLVCDTAGRYYLYGVTSWGVGCGSRGNYGVYSRVTHWLNWLKAEIAKN